MATKLLMESHGPKATGSRAVRWPSRSVFSAISARTASASSQWGPSWAAPSCWRTFPGCWTNPRPVCFRSWTRRFPRVSSSPQNTSWYSGAISFWRGSSNRSPLPRGARCGARRWATPEGARSRRAGQFWMTGHPLWTADRPAGPFEGAAAGSGELHSKSHGLIMDGRATAGIRTAERVLAASTSPASARLDAEASVTSGTPSCGRSIRP